MNFFSHFPGKGSRGRVNGERGRAREERKKESSPATHLGSVHVCAVAMSPRHRAGIVSCQRPASRSLFPFSSRAVQEGAPTSVNRKPIDSEREGGKPLT